MPSENTTQILTDEGQLAIATAPQSGTIISERGDQTVYALVETEEGNQLCVKTVNAAGGSVDASVYKPAGSVAFASLPTLSADVLGNVYNVTDSFTTTADFVEGAGKSYPAGTNVAVVEPSTGTYKFDVLSGFVDLSAYATTDSLATVATSGSYNDLSNKPTIPSVMTGATSGAAGTSGLVPAPAAGDQAKYLTGAGTWEQPSGLQNTATGTGSLTLLGTPTSYSYNTNIGVNANIGASFNVAVGNGVVFNNTSSRVVAVGQGVTCDTNYSKANYGVAVGWTAQITSESTVAIGAQAQANAEKAMAIGKSAVASGISSIQIGEGTNSTANTVQIDTYQVFNRSTGKLVAARIPIDGVTIVESGGVLTVAGGGSSAPTLTWYKNNTGTTVTISDTSSASLVKVYKNGILLEPTADYSISGTTLTMVTALVATDKIAVEVF